MGTTRKFLRNMDKVTMSNLGKATRLQKVVSAITAMGFVLQPVAAMASTITRADGSQVNINNGVADVWAKKVINDQVALNVFKQFDITPNDIANMYFKENANGAEAANLVNMVGSKININGTVNAIRNSKIGGNLYFLSSNGIAVGSSGVINAGTLTMMTPTENFMKLALGAAKTDGTIEDAINAFGANVDVSALQSGYLITNWNKIQNMTVAMNKSGTITVNGKLNTVDGIRMKAAHIDISKANNATAAPLLQSGVVDFSSLVKLNSEQQKNAGITDLKATVTGSGDIVLSAVANTVNENTNFAGLTGQNVQGKDTVQATINIGEGTQIIANEYVKTKEDNTTENVRGGIDISATATSGSGEAGLLGVDIEGTTIADILGSKIVKTDAQINIDGTLTADTINITAVAENSFEKDSLTEVGGLVNKGLELAGGIIPLEQLNSVTENVKIGYAKLASNAAVTIGSGAELTATGDGKLEAEANDDGLREGGALNISAISKISAEVGAEVEAEAGGEEAGQGKAAGATTPTSGNKKNNNSLSKIMPGAGVSVVDTDNNASVTIAGKLNSSGDANVSAHALSEVEAEAGVSSVDSEEGSQYVNAAVVVANINNASNVTLNGTTKVDGELNALAAAQNEVTTVAGTETDNNGVVNSAINVTEANSSANMAVGGNITAGSMNIAAENTISNEIQATTELGKRPGLKQSTLGQGTLDSIFGNASNKKNNSNKVEGLGKYFNAGAAVVVANEINAAKVTVAKGAKLTSSGDTSISADNTIEDTFISATSAVNNYAHSKNPNNSTGNTSTGTSSNKAAIASAAVISADMDNSAQVIIEGGSDTSSAPVINGANVNINANSAFEYDRLNALIGSVKDDIKELKNKFDEATDIGKTAKAAFDAIVAYGKNPSVDGAMDLSEAFQNLADKINLSNVGEFSGVIDDANGLVEDLLAFADVSNYTNFYTAASTKSRVNDDAKLALTGSINLNSIKNNAQVIVGKGAQIEANGKDKDNDNKLIGELNISATAKQHDVALNGKTKYFIPKVSNPSGASTAIGGSVGVHDADVNSLVVIGEGAKLSGNDVNLSAENDLQHTAITFGGGAATKDGITGMFAYMEGESNSIISVDDEASINAANRLALNANNDTNISNIIFDRTSAGNSAIGASIGIVDYGVNNIAAIADNDSDGGEYDTKGNDTTRDEVKDLRKLVNDQLSAEEKVQLGTKADVKGEANGKGKITANAVEINAATTGTITGVSVAGTTAGATQQRGQSSTGGFKLPAQIAGAGSGSANYISGNTAALLEGVDVTTTGTNGDVKVSASDESMIGAYSGAAALKKKGRQASGGGFSDTLAGAVAYNKVNTGVTAQIKDVSIKNAAKITNIAAREGAVVAAGLALGVDTSGQGAGNASSINAGVSASINEINNSTHAVMNNVDTSISGGDGEVPTNTAIDNIAQSKDIQVAGGITAQYAKGGGIGIGAAVSSLHATNDIQSKITGSTLKNVGTLKAYAASDLVQVGTAISAGVIQGQNGNGVQAAVADNQLTNNVGVTISGGEIVANSVEAKAFDGEIEAKTTHLTDLSAEGFDVDGTDAMADVNASQANVSVDKGKVGGQKTGENGQEHGDDGKTVTDFNADDNKGNLIVSGAASIIANTSTQGKVTAGAAAVNQTINNNFTVDITNNANITADTVQAKAESDTLMVGVAAGVAVSTGQQGAANLAGSVGVMQLNNNTKTTIENSTLTAKTIEAKAATKSRLINVAGQVSASKGKVAAGLATATNILNNTTGAYVYGSTIKGKDEAENTSLTVEADNNSKAYAVAVGVAAQVGQQGAALSGDVAVNKGKNNTEAIVGKRENGKGNTITNVDDINIKAWDNTTLNAISGGVTASTGNAGLGGAVAYNEVGNGDNDKQNTLAKLTDTVITTDKDTTIDVNAEDSSHMLAFAVGAAVQTGQTGAAAQGSAATSILHKNVEAAVSNVDIDKHEENKTDRHNAALNVTAQNTSEAITSADVMAISTANFAGGAAVAVTNSKNDTKASITGGNMNLKSGKVEADSNVDIINIGISAAVATGQGGSIAGNVAVNNIKNDTIASIDNATMNATGTIGVLANSKEHIRNYAGALAATVGQGYAAGGLSTAVNVISGNTKATVNGSTITAGGDDAGISVKEYYKDDNEKKYKDKDETLTGFVVNADSAHEIDNVVVTGGVAATAEFAVAGTGTVTVNTIKGATEASVTGTDVNATGTVGDKANVSVRANDNTEIDSHVGSASIAVSANGGVGVGIASDSNVMSRKVTAKIAADTNKKTVNANNLTVNAFNKHDILSNAVGVAAGGGAYAGVGVAGTVSVIKTDAITNAEIDGITSTNNGLTVNADHVNKVQLFGNSAALSAAMGTASVGTAVSVLNDGSQTTANLKNSTINHYSDSTADDRITAKNDTDILTEAANLAIAAGIGAGVSGVVSVNNMDNAVGVSVEKSTIGKDKKARNFTASANDAIKTQFATATGSGGFVAAGVGVGVNTIDTSVVTQVNNSKINATNVTVTADEKRDIAQTAVSGAVGGVAVGTNILVTNIGTNVNDEYSIEKKPGSTESTSVSTKDAYDKANKALEEQNALLKGSNTAGALGDAGTGTKKDENGNDTSVSGGLGVLGDAVTKKDANGNDITLSVDSGLTNADLTNGATAAKGGKVDSNNNKVAKGVQVIVNGNSEINATNKADIKAETTTKTTINAGGVSAGAVSANGTFSILNVKRNSGVTVANSTIAAKEIAIASKQAGTANMNIYQGTAGGTAVNVAVGIANLTGANKVELDGAKLYSEAEENNSSDKKAAISVKAEDNSSVDVNVNGGSVGMTTLGVLWSDASNNSTNEVSVAGSTIRAAKDVYETRVDDNNKKQYVLVGYTDLNDVEIAAIKANTISAKTIGGAVGAYNVSGVVANATDSGNSKLNITGNNTFIGNTIDIKAQNNPAVKAEAQAYSGSLLASAGATIAKAKADGEVEVKIGEGSEFTAKIINAEASVGTQTDKFNVEAKTIGGSAAGLANVGFNEASAENSMTVKNTVGKNTYIGVENLNIIADNASVIKADVFGVTIGGALASGNNMATTTTNLTTTVNTGGVKDKVEKDEFGDEYVVSSLGNVNIKASGYGDVINSSNGNGGGIVTVSSVAAKSENTLTTDTKLYISGDWNNIGSMTAAASNGDHLDIDADSLSAAVVGASGTAIKNTVSHTANVNVTGNITSDGKQSYIASNNVNHDVDLKGNGYGVGVGAAAELINNLTYTAKVNMDKATLKGTGDKGAIEALAYTNGNMDYDNVLKSAGLYAGTFAKSENTLTYDNDVTLTDTNLSTAKMDQDITLAATDETKASFETMADTQGGAIGASGATTANKLNRSNTISVDADSKLFSTNDVNIYAGANTDGISSSLNYNVVADAYNKTAVPVGTKPSVKNTMTQANQVTIAGNIDSVRHVNFKANKGLTTVATSAREYNLYTGESGKGSLTSTAFGEQAGGETTDNKVAITGNVNAGVHNELGLTISGSTTVKKPDANDDTGETGEINFDKITVSADQNWFNTSKNVGIEVGEITNSLMGRYLELNNLLAQYDKKSDEYQNFRREQDIIVDQMRENGFVRDVEGKDGKTRSEIFSSITIPMLDVNDIVISGGNINVDADNLVGQENLNAQAAGNLSITNTSDLYLKINDLVIKDKGGNVYLNGSKVNPDASNANTGTEPTITVKSSGNKNADLALAPDIGVFGKVINSTGDVVIENTNYNISVDGNANISARNITLKADKGSVSQNSEGLLLIGSDPVTKYQFNDQIALKIQKYLADTTKNSSWLESIDSYKNYVRLLKEHKDDIGLTDDDINVIDGYKDDPSKGIVAGNNVYISGLNVNIDGLVQSGYKNYKVDLSNDQAAKDKLTALENEYNSNRKALTNQEVMANEHYCITINAGASYNTATGVYDYNVRVYYNPYTKELLTETIEPNGGKIYITGAVSSTGNGKLRAMDGTPDIYINTSKIDKNLRINNIANKNIEGLISIKDTAKNTLTEYVNKDGKLTVTETKLNKGNLAKDNKPPTTVSGSSTTYKPLDDMTLSWSGGTSGDKIIKGYHYTKKFVLWGGIKYNTSKDFIDNEEVSTGKVETSTSSITGEDPLGTGITIGVKSGKPAYSVSTKHFDNLDDVTVSEIVADKRYDGWKGKIFGYGKIYYSWTETTGSSTSSTYTIEADKGIDVGFMTGGNGNINITSQKDMLLNGNISNATNADGSAIGKINLVSKVGSISSVGNARVNADGLTVSAATGVDINHGALGNDASIDVRSTKGNVTINSDKGNITFTGGADAGAKAGNLNLTAAGNLKTADGTTLNGTRIDFVSGGVIDANIHGGQVPTSSDTMSASVNARAQGDITLTQNNGDMRLGIIDSQAGDVVLNVENGSFVDAYNGADAGYSDTASKIQNWIDNGLISSADSDDSNANAAQKAYEERINGLNNRANALAQTSEAKNTAQNYKDEAAKMAQDGTLLQAKEAYIKAVREANGDQSKINAAYEAYKAEQNKYFDQRATQNSSYTDAERDLIIGFAEVGTNSSKYGWSKNQLLYAIQDTILNSEPGQKVDPTTQANVIGNNITLNAKNGGIGIDAAPETIFYDNLTTIDNMKKLAASKAGDLTWDDEKVTIRHQQPINLELRNKETGVVTVNGRYNVYIAAIKDSTLNFNKVETEGDIKLMADNGINMLGNDGIISGRNLIISSGIGSIGSQDKHIVTKVTGTVDANAGEYIYLEQKDGVLNLLTVAAGRDINIIADAGMKMSGEYSDQAGYINSTGGVINLTSSNGSIGTATENEYIRINNNGAVVNANAKNGVYIKGKKNGTMVLGEVDSEGTVQIISEGGVALGRAASETQTAVTGVINAVGNGNINARGDIDLTNGSVNITGDNNQFTMQAVGEVRQNENSGGIVTNTLNVHADKSHLLLSKQNNVRNLNASYYENEQKLIDGVLRFNGINEELNVSLVNPTEAVKGDVEITNLHEKGNVNIKTSIKAAGDGSEGHKGSISVKANKDITTDANTELNANNNIIMTAENGSITTNGTLKAENDIKLNTKNSTITTVGSVTATNGNVEFTAKEGIKTTGDVASANADVILANANNAIEVSKLTGKNVSVTNENGNIIAKADITATGGDITLKTTTSGDITTAENAMLEASADGENGGNIIIEAAGSITTKGVIKANRQVKANATTGFTAEKSIEATNGDVEIVTVNGDIKTTGEDTNITAGNDVKLTATDSAISTSGTVTAKKDVIMSGKTGVTAANTIKATNGKIDIDATEGAISVKDTSASANAELTAQTGIKATGAITSSNADVILNNTNNAIEVAAITGQNVSITNQNGNVLMNGAVVANKDSSALKVRVEQKGDITAENTLDGKVIDIFTKNGKITLKNNVIATDNVDLKAEIGSIETGNVTAGNNVNANATGDVTATGNITATNGNATINSSGANVTTKDVTAGTTVDIDAAKDITTNGAVQGQDVALDAGENIKTEGTVTATTGNVGMKAASGKIESKSAISAKNDATLDAGTSITTNGKVEATTGNVSYDAKTGITANGNVIAGKDIGMMNQENNITTGTDSAVKAGNNVTMNNNNGNIETGSTVTAGNDSKLTTTTGDITAKGSVTAGNNSNMNTSSGNITAESTVTAEKGNADFKVDQNGNVTTNGNVTANNDITYDAKGSITTGGSINSTIGNIRLTTDSTDGDMTFNGDIKADAGNISIVANKNGDMSYNGNVTTANGNIDIIIEGDGNISDTDKLFEAKGSKGDKATGNIKLQVKGSGDVDLNEIYATNDASLDIANGNLTLAKIDGNLVAIQLRSEGKKMDVKDIIAGQKIIAKGSNMDLDKIKQRVDADGMLSIVPDGASDDKPIDNLRIGEISTNTGVRFEHLWLNNGNIKVSEGKFYIDKLVVNNVAHFSNAHMTTAVWGNPPQRDDSHSVFWNDIRINHPGENLNEWVKAGTDAEKWMFLHFTEIPNIQRSNGVLLDLRNYDYVYNQRFTAVNHLHQLLAENKADEYDINFNPEVVHYFRHDLYDLDESEQQLEEHADPAKIVIEA